MERGRIKSYDKVAVLPIKKEAVVESLEKQEERVNGASCGIEPELRLREWKRKNLRGAIF